MKNMNRKIKITPYFSSYGGREESDMDLCKSDYVRENFSLELFDMTWACDFPKNGLECGECNSCKEKLLTAELAYGKEKRNEVEWKMATKIPNGEISMKPYEKNFKMLVPFYLMASYAYYEEDDPIISDAEFDTICRMLNENWDEIDHSHKWCIDKKDLEAGTGFGATYPDRVKNATNNYREVIKNED